VAARFHIRLPGGGITNLPAIVANRRVAPEIPRSWSRNSPPQTTLGSGELDQDAGALTRGHTHRESEAQPFIAAPHHAPLDELGRNDLPSAEPVPLGHLAVTRTPAGGRLEIGHTAGGGTSVPADETCRAQYEDTFDDSRRHLGPERHTFSLLPA
jgi:hypothetical protein